MSSGTNNTQAPADNDASRRKSSDTKFANLHNMKRNSTGDAADQRRESLTEQSQPKGILGNLWNSAVKPGPAEKK